MEFRSTGMTILPRVAVGAILSGVIFSAVFCNFACTKRTDQGAQDTAVSSKSAANPETKDDLKISWLDPKPTTTGTSTVSFELKTSSGLALSGAQVAIEATMTHPGMPSTFVASKEIKNGVYSAPINLTMAGDWLFFLEIKLANGPTVKRTLELSGIK